MLKIKGDKAELVLPEFSCEEIKNRIISLTSLVKAADRELITDVDIYWAMTMIEEYLPDESLMTGK